MTSGHQDASVVFQQTGSVSIVHGEASRWGENGGELIHSPWS
jgi:hypothetical protein